MLQRFLSSLCGRKQSPPRRRPARKTYLSVEALEGRELLSASVPGFTLTGGNLYHTTSSQPQLIDTGVQDFTVVNRKVFDLHTDHTLQTMNSDGSAKTSLGSGVQSLAAGNDGNAYYLQNGNLYCAAANSLTNLHPLSGTYTAIASAANHDVFALGIDDKLYRCTVNGVTPTLSGVQTLLQSYHGNGAPVVTVLAGGQLQQSDDGIHFSAIDLGGTILQLAAGQDSAGRQVLCALRQDGQLIELDITGEHFPLAGVQTLIQSYHANGAPVVTVLQGGHLQQSDDGIHFSTIDLGGPILQLAEGRNAAGQQLLYALRNDVLFVDGPSGVSVLATGVQTLIQSRSGAGVPVPLLLHNGLFQQSTDGATPSTIDLGGPILKLAEGRNAAGQQLLYALRNDGVLFVDGPSGVSMDTLDGPLTTLAEGRDAGGWQVLSALRKDGQLITLDVTGAHYPLGNVQTLLQSHHGNGAPVVTVLAGGQLQQSDDGIHFSTIDLGGTILQLAAGQDSAGRQVLCALRQDGQLVELDITGEHFPLAGVQTLIQSYHANGAPVVTVLQGGHLQQSDDGMHFSTIDLGGTILQIAAEQDSAGRQVLCALRQDGQLIELDVTGEHFPLAGVQAIASAGPSSIFVLRTDGSLIVLNANGSSQLCSLGSLNNTQGTVNQPNYSDGIVLSSGVTGYGNLAITGLPPGLNATVSGNVINVSGIPIQSGTFGIVVSWSVPNVPWAKMSTTSRLTIHPPVRLGQNNIPWTVNQFTTTSVSVSGGTGLYSLSVSGQPSWLKFTLAGNSVGLSGNPTQTGTFSFTLSVYDSTGPQDSRICTLTVTRPTPPPPSSNPPPQQYHGYVGYFMQFTYSYSWTDAYGQYHTDSPWTATTANLPGAAFNSSDPRNALNVSQAQLQAVAEGLVNAKDGGLGSFSSLKINLYYLDTGGNSVYVNNFSGV